jgi:N-methylhydantoinase B
VIGAQLDSFTLEILRSYLVSTVREMVATTTRTAYSTCFAHGEDFTCGLFDAEGRLIAQDQGVPVHAGALGDAVSHVIAGAGRIEPGDVFLHNDPYNGGTHQADGLVCRPIFAEGSLAGFAVNRGHWTDVGGMAPGGWSGSAEDVNQEALIIPSVRLLAGGEVVEDVKRMILRNVRLPVQLWGDIQAQIASNVVAERRIAELIRNHGRDGFDAVVEGTLDYSRKRFLAGLEQLADRIAEASDVIEDDGRGNGPLTIKVKVTKTPEGVAVDFAGTDPQALAPVNSTLACTKAAVICSLVAIVDADIPLNAGVVELIHVTAPRGSLVNPVSPAPAFGATADPSDRVSEALLRALAELAPERAPAGSYSTGNNVTGGGLRPDGSQFLWYSYQAGGCGARPWADGNSAEWHLMANSRNESMEVWETRYPVQFLSFGLIPDSGGPGRHRGGLGTERRVRITEPTRLSGISDHHRIGAAGLQGGGAGLPNGFAIERDGKRQPLDEAFGLASPSKFANLPVHAGDVFVSIQGGGGGFGDPHERERERVEADLEAGYVSPEQAASSYGYEPT